MIVSLTSNFSLNLIIFLSLGLPTTTRKSIISSFNFPGGVGNLQPQNVTSVLSGKHMPVAVAGSGRPSVQEVGPQEAGRLYPQTVPPQTAGPPQTVGPAQQTVGPASQLQFSAPVKTWK